MAKIEEVNYKEIPGKVRQMRTTALALNSEIVNSYMKLDAMKNNWHGVRYNELAKTCNTIIPEVEKLLKLVVTTIPFELEKVANNYSLPDNGSKIVNPEETAFKKVPAITTSTEETMRFLTSEVTSTKTQVEASLDKVLAQTDEILKIFNEINWKSEAADLFRKAMNESKTKLTANFNELKSVFTTLIRQASEDIQAGESHNTIS